MLVQKCQFKKKDKKIRLGEMYLFILFDFVSMNFTDSYIGTIHLGKMDRKIHLCKTYSVVKMYPTFVT